MRAGRLVASIVTTMGRPGAAPRSAGLEEQMQPREAKVKAKDSGGLPSQRASAAEPLRWSRYNRLFESQRFGRFFLYNALSNTLMELDEQHYHATERMRDRGGISEVVVEPEAGESLIGSAAHGDLVPDKDFIALLRENLALVEAGEEDRRLLELRYRRSAQIFQTTRLTLAICPTLACNFRCPYCFEHSQDDAAVMSHDTIERLLACVQQEEQVERIDVTWFGGEPTLAFPVIEEITAGMDALDLVMGKVALLTNGYLLTKNKIDRLNDLHINSISITLDGSQAVHDGRRMLAGGGPTYARIIANIELLMASSYEGTCTIRMNIDSQSPDQYLALRAELLERFQDKRFSVLPRFVHSIHGQDYDRGCTLDANGQAEWQLALHRRDEPSGHGIYPTNGALGTCGATGRNSFVVGPRGELYKCGNDVGDPHLVVGDIHAEDLITNLELVALYALGGEAFLDPTCLECSVLPICGGGCNERRLLRKYFGSDVEYTCSRYKNHLIPYLEEYYDSFRSREICNDWLTGSRQPSESRGYRNVHPARPAQGPRICDGSDSQGLS